MEEQAGQTTRRFAARVAYDGTDFAGWQIQSGQQKQRTVQGVLAATLEEFLEYAGTPQPIKLHASGRTDAGVHATGQVMHFDVATRLEPESLRRALNSRLPRDCGVTAMVDAAPEFHSRHQAIRRKYIYRLAFGDEANVPQARRFLGFAPRAEYDTALMKRAAKTFIGDNNFEGFRSTDCAAGRTIISLENCAIEEMPPEARAAMMIPPDIPVFLITVEARSFLMHMVRRMVGSLVMIGRGKLSLDELENALKTGAAPKCATRIAANGLCLERVDYTKPVFPDHGN